MRFADVSRLRRREPRTIRGIVFVALGVLTFTYGAELYDAMAVVTSPRPLLYVVGLAFVAAGVLARTLTDRRAIHLAILATAIGSVLYLQWAPGGWRHLLSIVRPLEDLYVLATGTTILSIVSVDVWVLTIAPGPVFLSWFFALRSRYASAAGVAMLPVVLLVLTGDLGFERTLLAVLAAVIVVGGGELARTRTSIREADVVAIVIAAMLVASLGVSVVPAGPGGTGGGGPSQDGGDTPTSDEAFVDTDGEMTVGPGPALRPSVRFTVTADEPEHWRVDAYDRYTGDGWVRSGPVEPLSGASVGDERTRVELAVRTEDDDTTAIPSLYEPVRVDGIEDPHRTPEGGIVAPSPITNGTNVSIVAARPNATREEIRTSDGAYDPALLERYTQLPADTPDRVGEAAANVTESATTPHEAAILVEGYLEETKNYSLDVSAPGDHVADEFLFERGAGYCVFFATTMATMLRSQDIPARMVSGYASGDRVAENRWVVRDMDAHAWVEVYIPSVGWTAYDPTPSGPYDARREAVLQEARENEREDVDTSESAPSPDAPSNEADESDWNAPAEAIQTFCDDPEAIVNGDLSPTEARVRCTDAQLENISGVTPDPTAQNLLLDPWGRTPEVNESSPAVQGENEDDDRSGILPPTEVLAAFATILIGGVAAVRRSRLPERGRYWLGLRWQGDHATPDGVVERAWSRLELYLERQYEGRAANESSRVYVDRLMETYDVDPRVESIARAYERARYRAAPTDREVARDVVETVDDLVGATGRQLGS